MKTESQKSENTKDVNTKDVNTKDGNVIALTLLVVLAGLMGLAS